MVKACYSGVNVVRQSGWVDANCWLKLVCFAMAVLAGRVVGPVAGQQIPAAEATGQPANLALVATAFASYVSGDTSVGALNDGYLPDSSADASQGTWGNWNRTGTQWAEYQWDREVSIAAVEVYWWDDQRGVRLPSAARLLHKVGDEWKPVAGAEGPGVLGDQWNRVGFPGIRTTGLRLEVDSAGSFSTGVIEWRVLDAGDSPDFPPAVEAGPDRVAVVGGRTFLDGTARSFREGKAPRKVTWKVEGGSDAVTIAEPDQLSTTASFSTVGLHRLVLEVDENGLATRDSLTVKVVDRPLAKPLQPVPTGSYRITSPLWKQRARALIVEWIPHCIRRISDPRLPEGGMSNFDEAAKKLRGEPHEGQRGYPFANAWVLNTVEAICMALQVDPEDDPGMQQAQQLMRETLEDWIPRILAAQEPDGYLQTAFTLGGMQRWSPRHRDDHEGYIGAYLIEAAIAHHEWSSHKDRRMLDAAIRLADCWDAHIGPEEGKQEWFDGHQALEMALVRLALHLNEVDGPGRGTRYIGLAKFLLDCRKGGHSYDQSHLPVVRQYEAVGHAVRAVYSWTAMADVMLETGDQDYESAVLSLWDNLVHRKYYVTGGIGSGETSEGFGPDYSLRQDGYCESCSSCGELHFQQRLNRAYGDARYADLYEETLYNALLGSVDLAGRNFYYQNPLDAGNARYDWHACPCCVGNIPRTLLGLPSWTYLRSAGAIHVNLFLGSEARIEGVAGTTVRMVQQTDFPRSGAVRIEVHPDQAAEFTLQVRSPQKDVSELYSAQPSADGLLRISVNGEPVPNEPVKGYVAIRRKWTAGDVVELELPLVIQRVRASDRVAATRGAVALRYGPLMFCFESNDQALGQSLKSDEPLAVEWRPDLLGGVPVIRGKWADGSEALAIPYYARQNRPEEEGARRRRSGVRSVVWVPEAPVAAPQPSGDR